MCALMMTFLPLSFSLSLPFYDIFVSSFQLMALLIFFAFPLILFYGWPPLIGFASICFILFNLL